MDNSKPLSVNQTAELLGVDTGTVYRAAANGSLGAFRVGRRILIPRAKLNELLGNRTETRLNDG